MRSCEEYEALISAFIDGALAEEDRGALMEHMASCPACQQYFDDQIAIHDALESLEVPAPAGFAEQVMEHVRLTPQSATGPERPEKKITAFPRWRRWAALAACCAVAALGVWAFGGQDAAEDAAVFQNAVTHSSAGDEAGQDTARDLPAAQSEEQGKDRAANEEYGLLSGQEAPEPAGEAEKQAAGELEAALTLDPVSADSAAAEEAAERSDQYVTVLITASPAAADWVEENLGEPWEAYRGYDLTAEQYGELLALLDQEGADFTLRSAEKEPYWYELRAE